MGKEKKTFNNFKQDVSLVLQKPSLILSIIVIGFFMIWFASEQVRTVLRFLIHFQLIDEGQVNRFSYKYLLFGLSMFLMLWADLMLMNMAYTRLMSWFQTFRYLWYQRQKKCIMSNKSNSNATSRRRYALRSHSRRDS